ncbi:MAG: protein YgfX [Burkholderiales bacterium]
MRRQHRLEIRFQPSSQLAALLFAAHAASLGAASAINVEPWLHWILCIAIVTSLIHSLRTHALLLASHACTGMRLWSDGRCLLQMRSGQEIDARLMVSGCAVSPLLVLLRVRPERNGRSFSLALLPDSADGEALRALRVLLRFGLEPVGS